METFDNLIPKLHKKFYFKEDDNNQTISTYSNIRYSMSATVKLNHITGEVIFTFRYIPIMSFKLERDPISNANQNADTVIQELKIFNQMIHAAVNRLTKLNTRYHNEQKKHHFHNRIDLQQMLQNPNYQLNNNEPNIIYVNGTYKTFEQARELFKQSLPSVAFSYKGFWIEAEPFDQTENGHPEDGFTYTSYVYSSKEDRDTLEDYIDSLIEVYDNPKDLEKGVKKAIDAYIKQKGKHL